MQSKRRAQLGLGCSACPWLGLFLALWGAASVGAQTPARVRVEMGMGPSKVVSYLSSPTGLFPEQAPGQTPVMPDAGQEPDLSPTVPPAPNTPQTPPPSSTGGAALPPGNPSVAELIEWVVGTLDPAELALEIDHGDPTPAFRNLLATIYGINDDALVRVVWRNYMGPEKPPQLQNPDEIGSGLTINQHTGNAIHRFFLTFAPQALAPPDVPSCHGPENRGRVGQGTYGPLYTVNGIQVRTSPYGASVGTAPVGSTITVLGDPEPKGDFWYPVETPVGRGYMTGFWLRFGGERGCGP